MTSYTVTLSTAQDEALGYAAVSQQEWIENFVYERARVATAEIVSIAVQKYLELGQDIPGSSDLIVAAAFSNGWVTSAANRITL